MQKSRKNGCSCPLHYLQLLSWVLFVYLSMFEFFLLAEAPENPAIRILLQALMGILICILMGIKIILTVIDPADDAVRLKLKNHPQPDFDRSKHDHVISDQFFCNICEEVVKPTSKHCRQCNKCIRDFDHHCKWLNNCVGSRNYKLFFVYVGLILMTTGCMFIQSIAFLILYATDSAGLRRIDDQFLICGTRVPDGLWLGLNSSAGSLSGIILCFTIHLFIFHMRLVHRGITTYNYIMENKRESKNLLNNSTSQGPSGWLQQLKNHALYIKKSAMVMPIKSVQEIAVTPAVVPEENDVALQTDYPSNNSNNKAPKLPPLQKLNHSNLNQRSIQNSSSPKPSKTAEPQLPNTLIQKQVQTSNRLAENNAEISSIPMVTQLPPQRKLPPIAPRPKSNKIQKVYEPHFESVLITERELALPSILVTANSSDTEPFNESLTPDISPHTVINRDNLSNSSPSLPPSPHCQDFPPGSTVYITSGQFTVTKITTPSPTPEKDQNFMIDDGSKFNTNLHGLGDANSLGRKNKEKDLPSDNSSNLLFQKFRNEPMIDLPYSQELTEDSDGLNLVQFRKSVRFADC